MYFLLKKGGQSYTWQRWERGPFDTHICSMPYIGSYHPRQHTPSPAPPPPPPPLLPTPTPSLRTAFHSVIFLHRIINVSDKISDLCSTIGPSKRVLILLPLSILFYYTTTHVSATFFRGDWSWNIFYGHSLPSADSRRAVVSFWRKNVHNTG